MKLIDGAAVILNPFTSEAYPDVGTALDAIRRLLEVGFAPPHPAPSFKDSHHAMRVLAAADKAKANGDLLSIEDADHAWLVAVLKERGPLVFRIHAAQIYGAIDKATTQPE